MVICKLKTLNKKELDNGTSFIDIINQSKASPEGFMKLILLYKETKMLPNIDFIKSHKQYKIINSNAILMLAEMFFEASEDEFKYLKSAEILF